MILERLLNEIRKNVGTVTLEEFRINILANPKKLSYKGITQLYLLLNEYEDLYFITIENIPYCIMPDAIEHILYPKSQRKNTYYDTICRSCDFKAMCPGWKEFKNTDEPFRRRTKDIPKEITVEITTKCNLDCGICTTDKNIPRDVPLVSIRKIIRDAKKMGIKAIRFTGGEPLLHDKIKEILLEAKKNKFYVILNSNATAVDRNLLELLPKTVDNILISLQGYNRNTDQSHTNTPVDWENKLANLLRLKSRITRVRVGTIISQNLIGNIEKYARLIRKMGISNWELYRPITDKNINNLRISKKNILEVMEFLLSLKKQGMRVKIANPVPFCISKNLDFSAGILSGAIDDDGYSRLVWDTKGYFKPGYFINEILGKSLKEAWECSFLKKIKSGDYLPSECKKCRYLKWCRGGSRAMAKLVKGTYFALDPLANPKSNV